MRVVEHSRRVWPPVHGTALSAAFGGAGVAALDPGDEVEIHLDALDAKFGAGNVPG